MIGGIFPGITVVTRRVFPCGDGRGDHRTVGKRPYLREMAEVQVFLPETGRQQAVELRQVDGKDRIDHLVEAALHLQPQLAQRTEIVAYPDLGTFEYFLQFFIHFGHIRESGFFLDDPDGRRYRILTPETGSQGDTSPVVGLREGFPPLVCQPADGIGTAEEFDMVGIADRFDDIVPVLLLAGMVQPVDPKQLVGEYPG